MTVEGFTITNKVYVPERIRPGNAFEERYVSLRQKEERVYTDEMLLRLPDVDKNHVHSGEWQIRRRSAERLINYISKKARPHRILEVGCGNGWLCRQLANIEGSKVIGTDVNFTELKQAADVFGNIPNLMFIYGEIESGILRNMEFDFIIFASCIQYFQSAPASITKALRLLGAGGEVHILDSPFYKSQEIPAARERTAAYYTAMGYPEMSRHYYHHSLDELAFLQPDILYKPSGINRFLPGKSNPFPWIRIKQSALPSCR
jgi:ubiquinone/menaquinone biosynthesis C-methylase UbiE